MKKKNILFGTMMAVAVTIVSVVGVSGANEEGDQVQLSDIRAWAAADSLTSERLFEDLEDAREALAEAEDNKGNPDGGDLAREKSYSYDIEEAELALARVLAEIEASELSLDLEGTQLYFDLLFTQEEMGLQSLEINALQVAYDEVEMKYEMGIETALAVTSAEVDLIAAEAAMTKLDHAYESLILDLNQLTNRDLSAEYILEDAEIPEVTMPEELTSTDIVQAIEWNKDLAFMKEDLVLLESLLDIYDDLNDDGSSYNDEMASTKLAIEEQEMAIDDTVRSIEVEIRVAYNDLLNAADEITISALNLESRKIDLAMAEEQLALGQVTENYVDSQALEVRTQALNLSQAKLDLYSSLMAYEWLLGGY